jgi:peroxiredoxin
VVLLLAVLTVLAVLLVERGRERPPTRDLAPPVADFTLPDATTGQSVSLSDFRGSRAVVLVFLGIDCPVAELYSPRLAALDASLRGRGVAFLAINSNALDTPAEVAAHARRNGILFPVLKDAGNVVADRLQVERLCEVIVLDPERRVRYRGAIDDQYRVGKRKGAAVHHYLADAIEAVLAGRPVPVAESEVFGCPIEREKVRTASQTRPRVRPAAPVIREQVAKVETRAGLDRVTFSEQVAPILQEKCQSCHRPGQVGPFALLTYEQARRRASAIREAVEDLRMPPWHADRRHGRFENDRSLSASQRATLLAWVDQGAPLGDPAKVPPRRAFPEGWGIGTPDAVVEMRAPYTVQAEGAVPYQRFRVPIGFAEDRWVQAAEARPGDRGVVHHISVFVEPHDPSPAHTTRRGPCLVTYAPGDIPAVYPPGVAKRIPAGSDLLLEIHYTPTGRVRTDRSSVGLIFARGPITYEAITKGIHPRGTIKQRLRIPPGADNYEARSSYTFRDDSHLLSLMPHMHLRGKDFEYSVTYLDGRREILLSVPAFDFGWQSVYRLAEPKALPRGTRVDCVAHYDNSAGNPSNPDPTSTVEWGDYTWDEMMIGYIDYYHDVPTRWTIESEEE